MIDIKQLISVIIVKIIQKYGPHTVRVLGKTYDVSRDVFNPKFYLTSGFMAEHMDVTPDDDVLDIGTGSGIQAITAGQTARKVIAIDINPEAVRYAEENVRMNGLSDVITVLRGDLFSPLKSQNQFDVIIFTPPYFDGQHKTMLDLALYDPDKKLISRFFREAQMYLRKRGYILMVYSSIADPERVLNIAGGLGWQHRIIALKKTPFERFFIYRFEPGRKKTGEEGRGRSF